MTEEQTTTDLEQQIANRVEIETAEPDSPLTNSRKIYSYCYPPQKDYHLSKYGIKIEDHILELKETLKKYYLKEEQLIVEQKKAVAEKNKSHKEITEEEIKYNLIDIMETLKKIKSLQILKRQEKIITLKEELQKTTTELAETRKELLEVHKHRDLGWHQYKNLKCELFFWKVVGGAMGFAAGFISWAVLEKIMKLLG